MSKKNRSNGTALAARNGLSGAVKRKWSDDQTLFDLARKELFVSVVGDVMDKLGLRRQFLPPEIRPLRNDLVVIGRAMPVLGVSVFEPVYEQSHSPLMAKEFGIMFEALDDLKRNEVYVCTGSRPNHACWGELMTQRALKLGAAGAVCDGYSRDTNGVLALNYPAFSRGSYGQDSGPRYKVVDFRVGIQIGAVRIDCGDIIFGDIDGVCVIPHAAVDEVFNAAIEKARGEKLVRVAIIKGMSARGAWNKFGIM